jgi:lysozyme
MNTPEHISQAGLNLIKRFEGLRLNAYRDAVGVWTIGYGHTKTARAGQYINDVEAERLLRQDVATFERCVRAAVTVRLNQQEFDALVSFAFNLGCGALRKSTLLRKLNALDTQGAADEFLRWVYAGGRKLRGLERRRAAERDLFLRGDQ